ncbi:hypothetical protein ANCCEY_06943 [Ancylostoma ceylanicum]|uniref:Tetraspanin family protein n=1 Tax=Ancylostoma ceylanicum TaxID=53326 RepID=A0A0D6LV82_9BILA|nr:hypothetical protein ANCCEY_06943 [Ancylostoma ceylanicum]
MDSDATAYETKSYKLLCGLVCVGIGTWLVLDKYAIDNLAMATAQIQGYEQDAGLRDLASRKQRNRQLCDRLFENDFREILRASLRLYNGTDSTKKKNVDGMLMKAAWDKLMIEKSCCGVDSKMGEFNESGWFHLTKGRHMFPPACCPTDGNGKLKPVCPLTSRHTDQDQIRMSEEP